jgi:hypothetical protein
MFFISVSHRSWRSYSDKVPIRQWYTNVANENCQILNSIVTYEESMAALKPLADGLMDRYECSGKPTPKLLYADRGCCRLLGSTAVEQLFNRWTDDGMIIRLDIFSSFDLLDCWPHWWCAGLVLHAARKSGRQCLPENWHQDVGCGNSWVRASADLVDQHSGSLSQRFSHGLVFFCPNSRLTNPQYPRQRSTGCWGSVRGVGDWSGQIACSLNVNRVRKSDV